MEGTSSGTLMSGPGHRRDTPFPGQAGVSVIVGRPVLVASGLTVCDDIAAMLPNLL